MANLRIGKMSVLVLILASVVLAVFAQLSLKRGMTNIGTLSVNDLLTSRIFSVITEKFVIFGLMLYFIASGLWLVVLSREELSFAYPLISLGYVFTAILAKIFFNESLTLVKMMGILLIVAGAYFIVLKI